MTQKQQIKEHLLSGRPLTSWEAIEKWHCTRLAAVIDVLKKEGINIQSTMKKNFNTGKRYAEYICPDPTPNKDQYSLFGSTGDDVEDYRPQAQHLRRR